MAGLFRASIRWLLAVLPGTVLCLCPLCTYAQHSEAPTGTGTISGVVVSATTGSPLRRARVDLQVFDDPTLGASAPTDASGRFTVRNLPAGKFTLNAWKRGFAQLSYSATTPDAAGEVITLRPGEQRDGVSWRLPPLAVISGVVTSADGDPLAGVNVEVGQRTFFRGKPTVRRIRVNQSDDRGRFRIFDLLAGSYVVSGAVQPGFGFRASAKRAGSWTFTAGPYNGPSEGPASPDGNSEAEVTYRKTYYGGSLTAAGATTVTISDTQPGEVLELRLPVVRMARITGEVSAPFSLESNQVNLNITSTGDEAAPLNTSMGTSQGRFTTMTLAEGTYRLQCTAEVDGKVYAGVQTIDLVGADVEGVSVPMRPAVDVEGVVDLDGHPTTGLRVQFVSPGTGNGPTINRGRFNRGRFDREDAEVRQDGKFVVRNVTPGVWDINVGPIPRGSYLKAMLLGTADVLRSEMTIGTETPPPLRISISSRAAEISGTVQGARKGVVLLAPDGATAEVMSFYERAMVDDQGQFVVRGITPGPYKLYAFTRLKPDAWEDPNFLVPFRGRGVAVDVKEGEKQTVQIQQLIDVAVPTAPDQPDKQPANSQAPGVQAGALPSSPSSAGANQ